MLIFNTRNMNRVSIDLDTIGRRAPSAVAAALNRTLAFTKTLASKEIKNKYEIQSKHVKETFSQRKASRTDLKATLISKGYTRSLTRFKIKPSTPPMQNGKKINRRKQVQVKITKTGGYTKLNLTPGAFVQTMNNATNVWQRQSKNRTDLKVLRSLSVPQMLENEGVFDKIRQQALAKMEERLEHEVNYRLNNM